MKKCFLTVLLLSVAGFCAFSQSRVTLQQAINASAREISNVFPYGTRIAVFNVAAPSTAMSEHVIEELNDLLVSSGNLTVIGQRNLGLISQEMDYQLSGYVSDETQQSIGRLLDLEMIVSGSVGAWKKSKSNYEYLVQVLDVYTGEVMYSRVYKVKKNHETDTLIAGGRVIRNFTPGERAGAAALNLAFGLGSLAVQRDTGGAFLPFVLEFYGGIMTAAALTGLTDPKTMNAESTNDDNVTKIVMYAGIGMYSLGAVIGIIKALTHDRPGAYLSQHDVAPWDLALVPDAKGKPAVQLSYTVQF